MLISKIFLVPIGEHVGILYPEQLAKAFLNAVVLGSGIVGVRLIFRIQSNLYVQILTSCLFLVGVGMVSLNHGYVETTPINIQEIIGKDLSLIPSRKPKEIDVIIINLPSSNRNIKLYNEKPECALLEQRFFNKNCKLSSNVDKSEFRANRDNIVMLKDILSIKLDENLIFSDEQNLKNLPSIEPSWKKSTNSESRKKRPTSKTVKFSEKFPFPGTSQEDHYHSENEDNKCYSKDDSNREKVKVKENFIPD